MRWALAPWLGPPPRLTSTLGAGVTNAATSPTRAVTSADCGVTRIGLDVDRSLAQQVGDVALLTGQHERHDSALGAGAGGAARAVQVRLVLGRRVDVDHELDVVDVHAASGDIRRDEHLRGAGRERREVAVARGLRQVAVQVDGGDALRGQLLRELLRGVLRAHEEDAATGAGGEGLDDVLLGVGIGHREDVVGHRGDGRVGLVDRVEDLVLQEALDELVHAVVERRAEQQTLTAARGSR